jgi:hypothetical protein
MESRAMDLLVSRVVSGDVAAWRDLQSAMLPLIERWTRSHASMRRRGLAAAADDVQDVLLATLERLRANDFANLRRYEESRAGRRDDDAFEKWLWGTVDFAVREHLRHRFGRTTPAPGEAPRDLGRSKRDLNTLAPRYDEDAGPHVIASGVTLKMTVGEVLQYVDEAFEPEEARAMRLYLSEGASYDMLCQALGLASEEDAERLIRKLKERLRIRFRS